MFPLGSVLLPGGILPLHVFEPRYRDMIRDCLRADGEPEFGQALISHGWETGGGDDRVMVGTVAQMLHVDAIDENRYALIAVGTRRIRVNAWLPDDPYPIADVDDWPDVDPDAPGLDVEVAASHARVMAARALAAQVAEQLARRRRAPPSWALLRWTRATTRSPTTRSWRRTTCPRWLRSALPTAFASSLRQDRRNGSSCSTRSSMTSKQC